MTRPSYHFVTMMCQNRNLPKSVPIDLHSKTSLQNQNLPHAIRPVSVATHGAGNRAESPCSSQPLLAQACVSSPLEAVEVSLILSQVNQLPTKTAG